MSDRVTANREPYYHELLEPLSSKALAVERAASIDAVERHFSGPLLHQELTVFLEDSSYKAVKERRAQDNGNHLTAITNVPHEIAVKYPARLWMKVDGVLDDNWYIGVVDTDNSPVCFDIVTKEEKAVTQDLRLVTRKYAEILRDVNQNPDRYEELSVLLEFEPTT